MPRGSEPCLPPSQSGTTVGGMPAPRVALLLSGLSGPTHSLHPTRDGRPRPQRVFPFLPVGICTEFHVLPQTRVWRRGEGEEGLRTKGSAWRSPVSVYTEICTYWLETHCHELLSCVGMLALLTAGVPPAAPLSLMSRRMNSVFNVFFFFF